MRIVIDAMSGDNAPFEIIKGAFEAKKEFNADIVLSGKGEVIRSVAKELGENISAVEILEAEETVTMEDDPIVAVRQKKNSSMSVGLRALRENADAFITAGNTGALVVGATHIIRPVKGVRRPCLATVLPLGKPVLLLDCGANINVTPEFLEAWAFMGSLYANHILGVDEPRVGLLNNGAEEHKGTELLVETYKRLKSSDDLTFVGNIEGRDIPFGACDVLVTDGFTGNVVLKYSEGFGKFFMKILKNMYSKNARSKMCFLAMKEQIMGLKKQFDAGEYGGAPLLGLSKPVIKAHGSANARVIKNTVRSAISFADSGIIDVITEKYR